ncbi:MAG: fasciclin domain-containing protein [Paracoccus sp. (in: a-proteobacteria)]|nr:fasciclin domain-containing protein [Paracoccus sp. (in: a-proteobacteria)]
MTLSIKTVGASILATSMLVALPALADHHMVGGAEMLPERNIVENAVNSEDHTTLVAAVQAAELVDTLSGEGPFTVFAPVNEAFEALPEGTVESLLEPENKEQLQTVLTCHVVEGEVPAAAVLEMIEAGGGEASIETVGGCTLTASTNEEGSVIITDENGNAATVTIADVDQSNGVIHVIDTVLLPAS